MNPLRLVLIGLSLLLFFHAFRGIKNGATTVKGGGMVYRSENPFWFWVNIGSVLIFAVGLLIYAFIAKVNS